MVEDEDEGANTIFNCLKPCPETSLKQSSPPLSRSRSRHHQQKASTHTGRRWRSTGMMVSVFERGRGSHRGGVSLVPLRVLALAAAFFLCAPLAALASTSTGGKSMTVSLTTPWTSGTTLLHEAAELLDTFDGERSGDRDRDRDRANLVWKFVDAWVKQDTTRSGEGDDRTCFARVLETAEGIVTPTQVKVTPRDPPWRHPPSRPARHRRAPLTTLRPPPISKPLLPSSS